jgi:hypothetical protein
MLGDRHADAGEAAVGRVLEALVLGRGEVAREAIVELVDGAGDRVIGEVLGGQLAEVAVLELGQRLVDRPLGTLAGEEVGDRVGKRLDVTGAQPDAGADDQQAADDGEEEGADERRMRSASGVSGTAIAAGVRVDAPTSARPKDAHSAGARPRCARRAARSPA